MSILYALATILFAVSQYQLVTDDLSQPIIAAANGFGLGWFATEFIMSIVGARK